MLAPSKKPLRNVRQVMDGACSIAGCSKPARSKGLCEGHYKRLWRYGSALYVAPARQIKHGHARGPKQSKTYQTWLAMLQRCNNPNCSAYRHYGGRGIKVCKRWHSFKNFLRDMGERPHDLTIERINNDGNYQPSNCCWATRREQRLNQRPRGPSLYHGAIHHKAKLTDISVRTILSRAGENQRKMAAEFGVTQATINFILRRRIWRHVQA